MLSARAGEDSQQVTDCHGPAMDTTSPDEEAAGQRAFMRRVCFAKAWLSPEERLSPYCCLQGPGQPQGLQVAKNKLQPRAQPRTFSLPAGEALLVWVRGGLAGVSLPNKSRGAGGVCHWGPEGRRQACAQAHATRAEPLRLCSPEGCSGSGLARVKAEAARLSSRLPPSGESAPPHPPLWSGFG